jgi:hypothetical protein
MEKLKLISLFLFSLMMTACLKEKPITPPDRPLRDVETLTVDMGGNAFNKQLYFDLGTGVFTGDVDRLDWDVAFDSRDGHFHLWLNSANSKSSTEMAVIAASGEYQMNAINSLDGLDQLWRWETSTGDTSLNALGPWWSDMSSLPVSKKEVLVMGRGYKHNWSDYMGNVKFVIDSVSEDAYYIRSSDLEGGNATELKVNRDPDRNFSYVSFNGAARQVEIEPPKEDWDLLFTRYIHTYDNPPDFPYPVIGILINPSNVEVGTMTLPQGMPFDSLDIYDVTGVTYSNQWDIIGFDWKVFDMTGYVVDPTEIYIIKSYEGDYYKFRFVDYYNDLGERGYPKFEFGPL